MQAQPRAASQAGQWAAPTQCTPSDATVSTGRVAVTTESGGRFCPQTQHPGASFLPVLARLGASEDKLRTALYGTQQLNCLRAPRGAPRHGPVPLGGAAELVRVRGVLRHALLRAPAEGRGFVFLQGPPRATVLLRERLPAWHCLRGQPHWAVPHPTCVPSGSVSSGMVSYSTTTVLPC